MEVARTADAILQSGASSDSPGYYAMSVGLVTLYRRPFTRNEPTGPIPTDLIPREFRTLHDHLSILRNKAFAHTDSAGKIPGHGKTTDLRFHLDGHHLKNFSSRTVVEPRLLPNVKLLAEKLHASVKMLHDKHLEKLVPYLVAEILKAGRSKEFELNIEDPNGPLLLECKPIRGEFPFVLPPTESN